MTRSRVALVTGASSGFGQATAALLAAQGFQVFGTSRTPAHNAAGGLCWPSRRPAGGTSPVVTTTDL